MANRGGNNAHLQWRQGENGEWIIPDAQRKYLEWLTDPDRKGTKTAWAEANDVDIATVRRWQRDPKFRQELDRRLLDLNIRPDRVQEVIESMHRSAVLGDVRAAETYLKYIGRFQPTTRVIVEDKQVSQLTDAELAALLQDRLSGLQSPETDEDGE